MATYDFRVNGGDVTVDSWDPAQPLLYVLRGALGLHGPKFGCGLGQRVGNWLLHLAWARLMKRRLRAAGIAYNDALFGLNDSGRMDRGRLLGFLKRLPEGVTELYCHPATRRWAGRFAPRRDYRCVEEFAALTDPEVAATMRRRGIATISFARLGAHHRDNAA